MMQLTFPPYQTRRCWRLLLDGRLQEQRMNGRGRDMVLLPRRLVRHTVFARDETPDLAHEESAVHLRAESWAPFDIPGFHFSWHDTHVIAWCWDQAFVDRALASNRRARQARLLPEDAVRLPGDGARLVADSDGVVGEVWRDGSLMASRWWAAAPDPRGWSSFLRAARTDPGFNPLPAVADIPLAGQTWTRNRARSLRTTLAANPKRAAALAAILLLLPAAFLSGQWVRLQTLNETLRTDLAALSADNGNQAELRQRARAARDDTEKLAPFANERTILEVLSRLGFHLGGHQAVTDDLTIRSGRMNLQLSQVADLDLVSLVGDLQKDGLFDEVHGEPGSRPNTVMIRAAIVAPETIPDGAGP